MSPALEAVLERLHARMEREHGELQARAGEPLGDRIDAFMLAIGEDAGRLLNLLAKSTRRRSLLEVGTSVGYSTLWLADAARATGGRVLSLELHAGKQAQAAANLREAGLAAPVELVTGDALASLAGRPGPFDLVLLDAWKDTYIPCFEALQDRLPVGALVAADNMTYPDSPNTRAYQAHVRAQTGWESLLVPIGNGVELSRRLPPWESAEPSPALGAVLARLHARMAEEDRLRATAPDDFAARRGEMMLAIGEDTGRFLHLLARASGARRVLEVGTSVGYSTLWLADAMRQTGGQVTTLDGNADKHRQASENLGQAGLDAPVTWVTARAPDALERLSGSFDLVLLDCERPDYLPCFRALQSKLAPGALVAADNMIFPPSPHAPAYQAHVRALDGWDSVQVPIGNGIELSRWGA